MASLSKLSLICHDFAGVYRVCEREKGGACRADSWAPFLPSIEFSEVLYFHSNQLRLFSITCSISNIYLVFAFAAKHQLAITT
jgi:hypothetical protein